jgi:hypothetical protein
MMGFPPSEEERAALCHRLYRVESQVRTIGEQFSASPELHKQMQKHLSKINRLVAILAEDDEDS